MDQEPCRGCEVNFENTEITEEKKTSKAYEAHTSGIKKEDITGLVDNVHSSEHDETQLMLDAQDANENVMESTIEMDQGPTAASNDKPRRKFYNFFL